MAERKYDANGPYGMIPYWIDCNIKRQKIAKAKIDKLQARIDALHEEIADCDASNCDYQGTMEVLDWEIQNLPSILIIY
jgi:peptidoglycan hydrolase CwlO-like protein